jgi:hypothetical protein
MQNSRSIISGTRLKLRIVLTMGYIIFGLYCLRELRNAGLNGILAIILIVVIGAAHIWYVSNSYIELGNEIILFSFPPKRIQLRWDDIKSVTLTKNMVLFNYGEKQMGMTLSSKNAEDLQMLELINEQCAERNIAIN